MISFSIVPRANRQAIQICCDEPGLATLIDALGRLRERGHIHLRTPANGGHELSETTPSGQPAIDEVIVTFGGK